VVALYLDIFYFKVSRFFKSIGIGLGWFLMADATRNAVMKEMEERLAVRFDAR